MSAPNLNQLVRDGELTQEQADEIIEGYWEREREVDMDRKAEQKEKQNEPKY